MSDVFTPYKTGFARLLARLGKDHSRYAEALVLQTRLLENIAQTCRYGDTETRRANRAQIVDALNALTLETLGVSFNKLCGLAREAGVLAMTSPTVGERGIGVGRDIIHSILITGDHNRVFVGDYEQPRDAYIPPWGVFERVRLDRFVGREWLYAKVGDFLSKHDRGYFILEAEAGLGKTTFLARLVKTRGYIHHFVELAPGLDGVAPGLRNLAAQVVRAWELNPYDVLPGAASRPDYLQNLLFDVARKRDKVKPGEPIILVVDALDEAGVPAGQNVLGLPRVLPQGVYFIVSQRPVSAPLRVEGPRRVFRLEVGSAENLADMRVYLERAATWDGVALALAEGGYSRAEFVETLLKKCRGVWIYLHYVVGEIEHGERSPLDLKTLPEGVWQYYAQYWNCWRKGEQRTEADWDAEILPLLGTLAAAQEALTLPQLCAPAGIAAKPRLKRVLGEDWRLFLAVERKGADRRYRLYHASLREFLEGRGDLTRLTTAERSLAEELAEAAREAHERIAGRYLDAWGGLATSLPGLQQAEGIQMDGGYGLRHLVAHLLGAGRLEDALNLLRLEWQKEERWVNAWYTVHERVGETERFLADVTRVWEALVQADAAVAGAGRDALYLGAEARCALIQASINSLAGNIPPTLLVALVGEGVWSPAQGLAYARQVPNARQRAEALAGLAPHLPEDLLREALTAARAIRDEGWRARALAGLAPRLAGLGYPQEALAAAREIQDEQYRAEALAGLAPHLPEELREQVLREALAAARAIEREWGWADALSALAPHLAEWPHDRLYPLWQETLPLLARRTRKDLLSDICALAPVIAKLGGPEAIAETFRAIQDVGRWWS